MNKIGEYLSIKHGWAFKGEYFASEGEQCILTPGNFYDKGGFKRNDGKERYYTHDYPSSFLCNKGDLILAMTEQSAGLLGSTAIVPENNKYLHNQRIGLITCDEINLSKMFAYYLFMTKSVRKQISDSATGTKVKHTSPDRISNVYVQIPDIKSQKLIASILWTIDSKIENNKKIIDELESMAKTLYDYWFVQFDFPDENGKPYKSSGGKMVYNEQLKRKIPDGWGVKSAKHFTRIETGKEDANFAENDGKYNFFTCAQAISKCNTFTFEGSAVLIAGNGDFNVKHYTGKFNAYQRTYVLIPNNDAYYAPLYIAAKDSISQFKICSNGSIVKFITKSDIENIQLLIPDNDSLYEQLNKYIYLQEEKEIENQELSTLRDWLLPILMNGQAYVEQINT